MHTDKQGKNDEGFFHSGTNSGAYQLPSSRSIDYFNKICKILLAKVEMAVHVVRCLLVVGRVLERKLLIIGEKDQFWEENC